MIPRSFLVRVGASLAFVLLATAIGAAPAISQQPQAVTVAPGSAVSFSVAATGSGTLSYQWRRYGVDLPAQRAATLSIASAKQADAGFFDVVVTDTESSVVSAPARLSLPSTLTGNYRLDTSFLPLFETSSLQVLALATDTAKRIYVGGEFTTISGQRRYSLARFDENLVADSTFVPVLNGNVSAILVQPDGRILVGGSFTKVNGVDRGGIARLNTDGTVDPSFDSALGFRTGGLTGSSMVMSLKDAGGGKVLVYSPNDSYNGSWFSSGMAVRLNVDGSLDRGGLCSGVVQPDGKVLVIGGSGTNALSRYNADGSFDWQFNSSGVPWANGVIRTVVVQPNGKIVVGGAFTMFRGVPANRIAQLNSDGSVDTAFGSGLGFDSEVRVLRLLGDGRIAAAGAFTSVNGFSRLRLAVLQADGSCDPGSVTADNLLPALSVLEVLPGGDLVVAAKTAGEQSGLAVFSSSGALDAQGKTVNRMAASVLVAAIQTKEGKWLVSGSFSHVDGVARANLVRLNADGTVDLTFNALGIAETIAIRLLEQGDGKILVLSNQSGTGVLKRLNPDGSADASFSTGAGFDLGVAAMALLPDGRIAVGGQFTTFDGQPCRKLAVLLPNGSRDLAFAMGTGFSVGSDFPSGGYISALAVQPDGRLLVGGYILGYNDVFARYLVRLNGDGSMHGALPGSDELFSDIQSIIVQPNGGIVIAGNFNGYIGGHYVQNICRLNSDLTFDPTYSGASSAVGGNCLVPLAGGAVLADARWQYSVYETPQILVRLGAGGSCDPAFSVCDLRQFWGVRIMLPTDDGRLLVIGPYGDRAGLVSRQIAMLKPDALPLPQVLTITPAQTRTVGEAASISAVAAGEGLLTYQWFRADYQLPGATKSGMDFTAVQFNDAGAYQLVVKSEYGVARASTNLTVVPRFEIAEQPADVYVSGSYSWTRVTATGGGALSYQWYHGDSGDISSPIDGANDSTYTLGTLSSWGRYWVRVTQGAEHLDSRTVLAIVRDGPVSLAEWTLQGSTPANLRGALDTPAGDDVCNLLKLVYGVKPMEPVQASWLPRAEVVMDESGVQHLAVQFMDNVPATGVLYELQVSADLKTWTSVPYVREVVAPNVFPLYRIRLREVAALGASGSRFARLGVRLAP